MKSVEAPLAPEKITESETSVTLDPACTPEEIEARSFALIDAEFPVKPFTGPAWEIARRLIHTSGDPSLATALHLPETSISLGVAAIRAGAPVYTDTEMVRAGIPLRRLEGFGCRVACVLSQPGVAEYAARRGITRTRAGMELLGDRLGGAVIAIGNAPTALLALIDQVRLTGEVPALVIGMPVGFVNASESKDLLVRQKDIFSLVVKGRRGGSPLAAAAVNALAIIAARS